ncbi:hypothetical protein C4D60_Mb10t13370 [Musa balbisiana]|uniref:Uncharacterized protein n=1 Tax=Musa balbisiana TaxID=52838 RepID=A0A4S8IWS5_MUSBA|nr:hypothetical protein C4D60_Mb10t13370 [Musa balbisiana]
MAATELGLEEGDEAEASADAGDEVALADEDLEGSGADVGGDPLPREGEQRRPHVQQPEQPYVLIE